MKRKLLIALHLFTLATCTWAMEGDTIWYDRSWYETSKDRAGYYRILEKENDSLWSFMDYYSHNNQLQNSGFLSSLSPEVRTDQFVWYYPNGNKETQGSYDQGEKTGVWFKFYETGEKKYAGDFAEGQRDGDWTWWFANGQIKSKAVYDSGAVVGQRTWWHENGSKASQVDYQEGKKEGQQTYWYPNGKVKEDVPYRKGQIHGKRIQYYENGQVKSRVEFISGIEQENGEWFDAQGVAMPLQEVKHQRKQHRLLWEISGNGLEKPSYLFGTMHVRDPRAFEFSDTLIQAFERSEAYSMEIHPDSLYAYVNRAEDLPPEDWVGHELPGETYDDYGYEDDFFFQFGWDQGWYANLNTLFHRMGSFRPDMKPYFLDAYLYHTAALNGKRTFGLENVEAHIKVGDNLPSYRKHFDILSKFDPDEEMVLVYQEGDINKIAALMDFFTNEEFQYRLLIERNYIMANSIDSLIKEHVTFNTCGSAHLPGKEGVITLLQNKGYTLRSMDAYYTGDSVYRPDVRLPGGTTSELYEDAFYNVTFPGDPILFVGDYYDRMVFMDMIDEVGYATYRADWRYDTSSLALGITESVLPDLLEVDGELILSSEDGVGPVDKVVIHRDRVDRWYKSHIIKLDEQAIILQVVSENKKDLEHPTVVSFFESLQLKDSLAIGETWEKVTREYGAFEVELPELWGPKYYEIPDPEEQYADPWHVQRLEGESKMDGWFVVRHNHYPGRFRHRLREEYFNEMKEIYNGFYGDPWNEEIIDFQGSPAMVLQYMFDDAYGIKIQLVERSGHSYVLFAMCHQDDPASERFFNSFQLNPLISSPLQHYNLESKGFAVSVPDTNFQYCPPLEKVTDQEVAYESVDITGHDLEEMMVELEEALEKASEDALAFSEDVIEYEVNIDEEERYSDDYERMEWVSTDTLAGIFFSIERHQFSPYYAVGSSDSLKKYLLLTSVGTQDSLWPQDFQKDWRCKNFEGSPLRMGRHELVINGKTTYRLTASYPTEFDSSSVIEAFFTSFSPLEKEEPFDFESRKTESLLAHLTNLDTTIQLKATHSLPSFIFASEDIPLMYEAIRKELALDTNDIFFNANVLLSHLIDVHDSTTVSFLEGVLKIDSLNKRTRLQTLEVLSFIPERKALQDFVEEIVSDSTWFVEEEYYSHDVLAYVDNLVEHGQFVLDEVDLVIPLIQTEATQFKALSLLNDLVVNEDSLKRITSHRSTIRDNFLNVFREFKSEHAEEESATMESDIFGLENVYYETAYAYDYGESADAKIKEFMELLGRLGEQDSAYVNALVWLSSHGTPELKALSIEQLLASKDDLSNEDISKLLESVFDQYAFIAHAYELGKIDQIPLDFRMKERISELQIQHRSDQEMYGYESVELDGVTLIKRKKVKINGEKVYLYVHQYYKNQWSRGKRFISVSGPQPLEEGKYFFDDQVLGVDRSITRKDDQKKVIAEMVEEVRIQSEGIE